MKAVGYEAFAFFCLGWLDMNPCPPPLWVLGVFLAKGALRVVVKGLGLVTGPGLKSGLATCWPVTLDTLLRFSDCHLPHRGLA